MSNQNILTAAETARLTTKSNWLATRIVLFDWTMIIGTLAILANHPNPLVILLAVFILGARQLGLGVIVHETGHNTLFSTPSWNHFVGNWLAGYWIFSNQDAYMKAHLKHHRNMGTENDPDLSNYRHYPVSRASLRRKFTRDLTGQLDLRRLKSIWQALSRLHLLDYPTRIYSSQKLGC